jgi:hypothetical protein
MKKPMPLPSSRTTVVHKIRSRTGLGPTGCHDIS